MDEKRSRSLDRRLPGVESDGIVSDAMNDHPGQLSFYIPPGDTRREDYRLSTYKSFPVTCPVSRSILAECGFYFIGFFDKVKCFECGRTVEQWEATDNPAEFRWHKSSCLFSRGRNCGNTPISRLRSVDALLRRGKRKALEGQEMLQQPSQSGSQSLGNPINEPIQRQPAQQWRMANVVSRNTRTFLTNLYLNRELDRLASFTRWPTESLSPTALARSGFFYLGDLDRTQCFSCGGVLRNWSLNDDPFAEHRTRFGQCLMVLGTETNNLPVPEHPESQRGRETGYPCRYPCNPQMRSRFKRLETFRRWPTGGPPPDEIAEAGFVFSGVRDRVKCWYCDGSLEDWMEDDIPWAEHAKWFPNCQFLLRVKGQHFVKENLIPHLHLDRPTIPKQRGSPWDQSTPPEEQTSEAPITEGSIHIIDPQAQAKKHKEKVKAIMRNSDAVKTVLEFGYDEKVVASALQDRISPHLESVPNDICGSAFELLIDVIKKVEEIEREEEDARLSRTSQPANATMSGSDRSSPEEQEEHRMCKICYNKAANMLFLPCRHMCCCMDCTRTIHPTCPVCRNRIDKAMKTYQR